MKLPKGLSVVSQKSLVYTQDHIDDEVKTWTKQFEQMVRERGEEFALPPVCDVQPHLFGGGATITISAIVRKREKQHAT